MSGTIVIVNDKMQRGYRYMRVAPAGDGFDPEFRPDLTPVEMLALGGLPETYPSHIYVDKVR